MTRWSDHAPTHDLRAASSADDQFLLELVLLYHSPVRKKGLSVGVVSPHDAAARSGAVEA